MLYFVGMWSRRKQRHVKTKCDSRTPATNGSHEMAKDATQLLNESIQGTKESTMKLLELVYDQLREIADRHLRKERSDHSLQPTALVHEAFIKLIDQRNTKWENSSHFRAIASNIMRRILVDHARAKTAQKRGRDFSRVSLSANPATGGDNPFEIVALDDLLNQLANMNERHAKIVEYRVFGGMSIEETAQALEISPATVKNDWRAARAWLMHKMEEGPPAEIDSD